MHHTDEKLHREGKSELIAIFEAMKEIIYSFWMLVGTYTGGGSEGIYVYRFDPTTAQTELAFTVPLDNPSYLAASADGSVVYAVSENGSGEPSKASALSFDRATGALALLDSRETALQGGGGEAPCNITTDGRKVVTANYGSGDLSVFAVCEDGALSPLSQRIDLAGENPPAPSHAHCVKFSPEGRWLFVSDLGRDRLLRFEVKEDMIEEESRVEFSVPEGSGPRHFIFDKAGQHLYLINELSGTVMVFGYESGELKILQTVQADTAGGRGSADIVLTPDGRWLYASNRLKNDGVAIFAVNPADGTLSPTSYRTTGIHPRNLSIAPGGRYLLVACRDSDAVEVFGIDPDTGALTPTGRDISLDSPVCTIFIPAQTTF
jgi:6-phosphogluconolactonase (cycloisomerase 2 family)